MKNICSVILCILACHIVPAIAQPDKWQVGVKAGISIPNLTNGTSGNPISSGYSSRLGPDFDVTGEYRFTRLFSVEIMAEYSSQGGKKNGMQAFTTPGDMASMFPPGAMPQYLYADYKSDAKLDYLMIPVVAKLGWGLVSKEKLRLYVDAGPFLGILVYAHNVTKGSSNVYLDAGGQQQVSTAPQSFNADEDVKNQLNMLNVGVTANLGLAWRFGRNHVFIEVGGNYGFLNIQKSAENGSNNTGAATVMLGYCFGLGRLPKAMPMNSGSGS